MKILIDMNLSPIWCKIFDKYNVLSKHWSHVGDIRALDQEIFDYAKENNYIIFTHDLDFGTILALSADSTTSVIQVRTNDPSPENIENILIATIKKHKKELLNGALITIDKFRARIKILPISD